jgi:hypothetical protein
MALEICIFMDETIDYPHEQRLYNSLLSPDAVPLLSEERLGEVCFENAGEAGNARKALETV